MDRELRRKGEIRNVHAQQPGLRFDIYERVTLGASALRASDWDSFELTPDVRVEVTGGQATVKGNLLLSGYAGGEGALPVPPLEHRIPVEITIPLDRVASPEDVRVEVESFDVDFADDRHLNVSGVLALYGVDLTASSGSRSGSRSAENPEETPAAEPAEHESLVDEASDVEPSSREARDDGGEEIAAYPAPDDERGGQTETDGSADRAAVSCEPHETAKEFVEPPSPVSFAGSPPISPTVRLSATSGNPKTDDGPGADARAASDGNLEHRSDDSGEKTGWEWKRRFLARVPNEPSFRRVRVCIVQRDETLESIAEKYRVKPNDIALYNRLEDSRLREGQVLYIPVS